ncbi:Na+/H+ antiporter NhaA [Nocardioides panacisoli]|uniref:Na+/H+ antiporter NhaA n=1 Tax=Nocardioides panacisoli TaxID=627624 RepID=UPI001C636BC4|nr:Na+/H+ antiporter NhaA [Nocardioides panacisoli]QYJ03157.1 Na+/H+ antiporter NhaA [Nocardioides panacisoli]
MQPPTRFSGSLSALWNRGPIWTESNRPSARLIARPLREFLRIEASGSILLLIAAAVALLWANSPWASAYDDFWHLKLSVDAGSFHIEESLQHWVNDGLMVIFFFVVGLEIKHELVHGDLRDPKTASLPIVAAIGGMVLPALLYIAITGGTDASSGWGIPMATDIAFAVGVLGLLGRRIPSAARVFMLTLAIVDDIGAILVIAVFYTDDLSMQWLAIAGALLALIVLMRMMKIWAVPAYVVVGVALWFAVLESGVHATLAGVALGLLTPATALLNESVARDYAQQALRDRHLNADELHRLRFLLGESVPMVERLQNRLHPLSSYFVLPVFALANAGVQLGGLGEALSSAVALGIGAGLVIGKPVGIVLACFIAIRLGLGTLPRHTTWAQVVGLGFVAGIGFTVSLFIAGLSFGSDDLTDNAKIGILFASAIAAVAGTVLLATMSPQPPEHEEDEDDSDDPAGSTDQEQSQPS